MLLTSSWILDSAILLTSFTYLLYKYVTRNFDYWKKLGVFYFEPTPFVGNFSEVVTMKSSLADTLKTFYDKTDEPYFGVFTFDEPVLVVKSPQLLKHILIKDFTYFKHRTFAEGSHNKISSNWLFFQKYTAWKHTRSKLSQMFSSGKLKNMLHSVSATSALFEDYLNGHLGVSEAKDLCMKFTTESTAKCFFGIRGKCFENGHNELNEISKRVFEMSFRNAVVHSFFTFKPFLVELFKLNFMRKADMDYLLQAFETSFNRRKAEKNGNKGKIKDYIDIMLESGDTNDTSKSDYESDYFMAMANTLQFYIGGIETSASSLSFTLYEWAMNPDIQEKARKEVVDISKKYDKITYDCLQEMEYLDMCMAETGRKYPLFQMLDRRADMDYKVPDTNLTIKKGTKVYIPFYALHMDEKYFPEPQKYNPERFLDKTINSDGVYYMPFGSGPRTCIGERFAMMSMKIFLATFLRSFKVEKCDKTPSKITFDPNSFVIVSKDGVYLRFKRLNEN